MFPVANSSDKSLMRHALLFLSLVPAGICPGCGGPHTSTLPPSSPLHGGILITLPEGQGYVELLNDKRERKGYAFQTDIVAFLLQPDQKTALSGKPSRVSVKLDTPRGPATIDLAPKPDPADPAASAKYASELGPYELNQRGGEVTVAIDGKTLTAPFRGPR
jgi:hypothetical protein